MKTQATKLRKKILKQRGVELAPHTCKPVSYPDLPSPYRKSPMMRLIEATHGDKLENLLYPGTIYEVAKRLNIDYSTVSKWRKIINEVKEQEFFKQFE